MRRPNPDDNLQTRRDFFKKAAKSVLPILGAVVLLNNPTIAKAAKTPMGCEDDVCEGTCMGSCQWSCKGTCQSSCMGGCMEACGSTCKGTCNITCENYCQGTCTGSCMYACSAYFFF